MGFIEGIHPLPIASEPKKTVPTYAGYGRRLVGYLWRYPSPRRRACIGCERTTRKHERNRAYRASRAALDQAGRRVPAARVIG
jgi:hypothetical protein